jgi:transposase-like protein
MDGEGEDGNGSGGDVCCRAAVCAVLAVECGEPKMVVAAQFGVSRQTLYTWVTRYARDGLGWLGGSVTVVLLVSASGAGRTLGARMRPKWST